MSHPVIRCGRSEASKRPNEAMRVIARCPDGVFPSVRRSGGFDMPDLGGSVEDAGAEIAPGAAKRARQQRSR